MIQATCQHCSTSFLARRKTRRFCSVSCANRSAWAATKSRDCRHCGSSFVLRDARDANRQHCSRQCAKSHSSKSTKEWMAEHPERLKIYRNNQLEKHPAYNKDRWGERRKRILDLLGGSCVVCGVTNLHWLHVDFIPTSRELQYRHPRHYKFISEHRELFRILCANHHYELTLTGQIQGTQITQQVKGVMPNAANKTKTP